MKKALLVLVISILTIGVFVGCTQEKEDFVCDFCKKQVTSVPHVVDYKGDEIKICDDCYEGLKKLNVIK